MDYKFRDFDWLATTDGFNVPTDVYYGTVYIGTLESKPDGYVIKTIDSPSGQQTIRQSDNNKFKSKNIASSVLHRAWKVLRQGSAGDNQEKSFAPA